MKNIQLVHIGQDYSTYSYINDEGKEVEVEVTGIAQELINTLGNALYKKSFIKKIK